MRWLSGKTALITGAGEGIGRIVVKRFLEEGCAGVVAFDIAADRLQTLGEELDGRVLTFRGDVRSLADNRAAVELAVSSFGKLDIFIGNAGIYDGRRRLTELSESELNDGFNDVFAVNVKGYLLGAMATREELARNKGCIVYTLSTSSFYVGGGPIYVASKHACLGLTRSLAHELAPEIRVNGVAPSGTPTALADSQSLRRSPKHGATVRLRSGGPGTNILGAQIEAADHAGAYVLLASEHARIITGAVINSDGGRGLMLA